ncbi:MAG: histidine phosphatase family protein [Granulosicoccus sp.]|nr:histidine phosphatase family protein [Granulosicoccus sp.]
MRHAKSSWKNPGFSDHDRPLNKRGDRDAPLMAQRLLARNSVPNLILSSSAARALATAEHLKNQFDQTPDVLVDQALYLASPTVITSVLNAMDPGVSHILVVAHNPGLEDLCAILEQDSPSHLPTAAIRQFSCPVWDQITIEKSVQNTADGAGLAQKEPWPFELIYSDFPKNDQTVAGISTIH